MSTVTVVGSNTYTAGDLISLKGGPIQRITKVTNTTLVVRDLYWWERLCMKVTASVKRCLRVIRR